MIKVKVYDGSWGRIKYENCSVPIGMWTVMIYFIGFPVYGFSVQMGLETAEAIFGNKIVKKKKI